ncbi:MAG: AAA family ATPase [Candidatus Saccharimonas sp.]
MKALHLTRPYAIMMVGLPGSGKTCFAKQFAKTFSTPFFDTAEIEQYASTIDDAEALTLIFLEELVKTSQTFIFEGSSITRARRTDFAKWARTKGYQPLFVWVQTDPNTSLSRALKAGSISEEDFTLYQENFSPPHPDEKPVVISGRHTYAMQVKVVLSHLGRENRPAPAVRAPTRAAQSRPVSNVAPGKRNISIQ